MARKKTSGVHTVKTTNTAAQKIEAAKAVVEEKAAEVKEAAFKLKDGEISDVITTTNPTSYATEYYVVKMVKNQNKGNDMDKYKDQLKDIATETKLSDNAFTTKVIGEELKDANVKIKDDALSLIHISEPTRPY